MQFYCKTDESLQWLEEEFLQYLQAINDTCKRNSKKFLNAEIYEALFHTGQCTVLRDSGFFYVLTRDLSSDSVELLSGGLRQMAGGNDCLDARTVTFSLEKILPTGILCVSQTSNVGTRQSVLSTHSPPVSVKFPATSAPEGPLATAARARVSRSCGICHLPSLTTLPSASPDTAQAKECSKHFHL